MVPSSLQYQKKLPAIIKTPMKKTTYILVLFTIILIVLFLWQELETLDIKQKINDDKLANFFTAFGGIIVAISLYFFYEQLIAGNSPDLYFSSVVFNVTEGESIYENKKSLKFFQIIDEKISDLNSYFVLYNTGTGTCKNILIKWIYDLEEIKKIIKNDYQYFPIFSTESQQLSFIESNGKIQIEIPEFYFYSCAPEFNFNEKNHSELAKKLIKGEELKPKLNVEITYYDSRNNKKTKKLKLEIQAVNNKIDIKFKHL
ncbi:hypothetical protein BXU01_17965 [[Flexibacter] sp. ATCC 35103]|nr:hypothetical protein BXU01_17965 [[Flexibacter] sp. ATCC 35103]